MPYHATDAQVEEIVLLSRLTDMRIINAAYAVIHNLDQWDLAQTMDLSARISAKIKEYKRIQDELDNNNKAAHSPPTQQPEYVNAEEGRTHESELVPESRPRG